MITLDTRKVRETGRQFNPFLGLRPFEYDENYLFFGREGQSKPLIAKLERDQRFLAVVGTSGSGKSSLVRAGLLPALLGGFMAGAGSHWRIAILRPGNDPIGNLARALSSPDVFGSDIKENADIQAAITEATLRRGRLGLVDAVRQAVRPARENLLVVVDQCEELFRYARVAEGGEAYWNEAATFVKMILAASREPDVPIYVVLTMRSDYLGDCAQFRDLPEAVSEGQYLIPRLTPPQLRETMTGPVAVAEGSMTKPLVNRLIRDIGDNQDQLPVLQHVMMRMWDESKELRLSIEVGEGEPRVRKPHAEVHEGDALDLCCYEAVGGMAEALSLHADEAYGELGDAGGGSEKDEKDEVDEKGQKKEKQSARQHLAEKMFKALTERGTDNRETRRPVELKSLCALTGASEAEVAAVVEVFRREGRSFLMPPPGVPLDGDSLIDITHESLIRNWKRLRDWVDEEARSARTYRRLAETGALYEEKPPKSRLWSTPDLELALLWREQSKPNKVWAQRYDSGYDTAMGFLDKSLKAHEDEEREKGEKRRKELKRARLLGIIFGVLSLVAVAALIFAAVKNAEAAASKEDARVTQENADKSKQEAEGKIKDAERRVREAKEKADTILQAADEATSLAELKSKLARENEEKARESERHAQESLRASRAATALADEKTRQMLYTVKLPTALQAYEAGNSTRALSLLNMFASPSGGPDDLRGFEWYYLSGLFNRKLAAFDAGAAPVTSVAVSPGGKMLATGGGGAFKVWDASTQNVVETFDESADKVVKAEGGDGQRGEWPTAVAFSPDGKLLATGSDRGFKLIDLASKKSFAFGEGGVKAAPALAFSHDGRLLATGDGGKYQIWDVSSRRLRGTVPVASRKPALAFSFDGSNLAIQGEQLDTVELWRVNPLEKINSVELTPPYGEGPLSLGFMHNDLLVSNGESVEVFGEGGRKITNPSAPNDPWFSIPLGVESEAETELKAVVAYSPDGKTLATAVGQGVTSGGGVKIWDAFSLKLLATLDGLGTSGNVSALSYSADGKTLAVSVGNAVQLSDVDVTRNFNTIVTGSDLSSVAALPGGERLATATEQDRSTGSFFLTVLEMASNRYIFNSVHFVISGKFLAFSRDGRRTAVLEPGGAKGTVRETETNKVLATLDMALPDGEAVVSSRFRMAAFSQDGKTVAVNLGEVGDDAIQLFDAETGRPVSEQFGVEDGGADLVIIGVEFSSDGRLVAMHYADRFGSGVEVFDLRTRQYVLKVRPKGSVGVRSMAFSPDGKTLAIGNFAETIDLWDIASGRTTATLDDSAAHMAFSADGKTLAVSSGDSTIRLWNVPIRQPVLTLTATSVVTPLTVQPDARGRIRSLLFSEGGRALLAVNSGGDVSIWRVPRPPQ